MSNGIIQRDDAIRNLSEDEVLELIDLHVTNPPGSLEGNPADWPAWTDTYCWHPDDEDASWWSSQTCGREEQPECGDPPPHTWKPSRYQGGER